MGQDIPPKSSSAVAAVPAAPSRKGASSPSRLANVLLAIATVTAMYLLLTSFVSYDAVPADRANEPIRFFISTSINTAVNLPERVTELVAFIFRECVVPTLRFAYETMPYWIPGLIALYVVVVFIRTAVPDFARLIVDRTKIVLGTGARFRAKIKTGFRLDQPKGVNENSAHSHPRHGELRQLANTAFGLLGGEDLYHFQMSKSQQEQGVVGKRIPYWTKDLQANFQNDPIKEHHVLAMTDVDYYVDMNKLLSEYSNPILMYTCMPTLAAGNQENGVFHWLPKLKGSDEAVIKVVLPGGGVYEGPLWHFPDNFTVFSYAIHWWVPMVAVFLWIVSTGAYGDFLATVYSVGTLVTFPWWFKAKFVHVEVHTQQQDVLKALVCLVPMTIHNSLWAFLARYTLGEKPLRKFDPILWSTDPDRPNEQWAVLEIISKNAPKRTSFARVGDTVLCGVCDTVLFERVRQVTPADGSGYAATVRAWLKTALDPGSPAPSDAELDSLAALFVNFMSARLPGMYQGVFSNPPFQLTFTPDPAGLQNPPNPVMVGVFEPLVAMAVMVPDKVDANLLAGIQVRVRQPQIKNLKHASPSQDLDSRLGRACAFFAQMVASLDMLPQKFTHAQVLERAKTKNQEHLLREALKLPGVGGRADPGVPFAKAEPVKLDGAARVITPVSQQMKAAYAAYIYPLMDYVKRHAWYGFDTPEAIAAKVTEAMAGADYVVETDFSKFDGHITGVLRHYCDMFVLRTCYKGADRDEVLEVYKHHRTGSLDVRLHGPLGGRIMIDGGDAQKSGAMDTSIMNTVRNAFICFHTYVRLLKNYERAWNAMASTGVFGGDDGIVAIRDGISPQAYVEAQRHVCCDFGLVIEAKIGARGTPYTYLSRYWNSWDSPEPNSCADIARALKKLHLTTRRNTPPREVVRDKVLSILCTDRNTPILGEWAATGAHALGVTQLTRAGVSDSYWGTFDTTFPNAPCSWYGDVLEENFPEFNVQAFRLWAAKVRAMPRGDDATWTAFTRPPCCWQPSDEPDLANVACYELVPRGRILSGTHQVPAVVGGRVRLPEAPPEAKAPEQAPAAVRRGGRAPRGAPAGMAPVPADVLPGDALRAAWLAGNRGVNTARSLASRADASDWRAVVLAHRPEEENWRAVICASSPLARELGAFTRLRNPHQAAKAVQEIESLIAHKERISPREHVPPGWTLKRIGHKHPRPAFRDVLIETRARLGRNGLLAALPHKPNSAPTTVPVAPPVPGSLEEHVAHAARNRARKAHRPAEASPVVSHPGEVRAQDPVPARLGAPLPLVRSVVYEHGDHKHDNEPTPAPRPDVETDQGAQSESSMASSVTFDTIIEIGDDHAGSGDERGGEYG